MEQLISIFREVRDPRDINARHDCCAMIFVTLLATLCGAKSSVDVADFCSTNLSDLKDVVNLSHGAPSHDCFSRLFRLLNTQEMERALALFVKVLRKNLGLEAPQGVIAVDGKRLRRGYECGRACFPPLMISVWDTETRLSLAARAGQDGNEVKATLEALKTLDLKGTIVTGDALHCHPAMAKTVRGQNGHYALKLKKNNAPLYICAQEAFALVKARGEPPFWETRDNRHGRCERRRASVIKAPAQATQLLPGLLMFGRIESERCAGGGQGETHTIYVALSKRVSPRRLLEVVRAHWGVENNIHWPLDIVFCEDDARTRKDNAPYNLSIIRRMALDILSTHPDNKSIARKMKCAAWSKSYLFGLFT